jgi:hypothetical protein
MSDGYKYDLFLSYKRTGDVPMWVANHFYPLLTKALENLLPATPKIFLDTQQEIGVKWPNNLAYSLRRSSYMIAVWSVPYFYSPWCMAEWNSMLKREQLLGMGTEDNPHGLVYPVVFAGTRYFPKKALDVQARTDLSRWAIPFLAFKDSDEYLPFYQAIREIAEALVARLDEAPQWQPNWPVVRPKLKPQGHMPPPQLGS